MITLCISVLHKTSTLIFYLSAIVPLQNTLSVLFLVLAHHPEVQERVRQEVTSLGRCPTVEDLDQMTYTRACMLEIKRFHTPLPISARHCNRSGDAQFEKFNIPRNTEVCISTQKILLCTSHVQPQLPQGRGIAGILVFL